MSASDLLEQLIYPPAPVVLLICAGLVLLAINNRKSGFILAFAGVISLYLVSSPMFSFSLMNTLESLYPPLRNTRTDAQVIVVLGAGRSHGAGEDGEDIPNIPSLTRISYAAQLHRETGLPILATGGRFDQDELSEAELMQQMLQSDFDIPTQWLEGSSHNTYENAIFSAEILRNEGIDKVLLVTHAYHMPRAMWCFQKAGLSPVAAPTAFHNSQDQRIAIKWLPYYQSMSLVGIALHEWLGLIWYRIKYR